MNYLYEFLKLVIFLSCINTNSFAQINSKLTYCNIRGNVIDSVSEQAIPYCNVLLIDKVDSSYIQGVMSDENGEFVLNNVTEGYYLLKIINIGYEPEYISLEVKGVNNNLILNNIRLVSRKISISGTVITAERPIYYFDAEKKIYNCADDVFVQGGTAADALQNAPGVWVEIDGSVTLRGRSDVAIWINNKPSKLKSDALKAYLKQLPAIAIERIEVITNPTAKYSANSSGGIINIILKENKEENYFYNPGINYEKNRRLHPWIATLTTITKLKINSYFSFIKGNNEITSEMESVYFQGDDTIHHDNSQYISNENMYHYFGYLDLEYAFSKRTKLDVYTQYLFDVLNWNTKGWADKENIYQSQLYRYESNDSSNLISKNLLLGMNVNHNFLKPAHMISADVYLRNNVTNSINNTNIYYIPEIKNNRICKTNSDEGQINAGVKILYKYPVNDSTIIESGFSYDHNFYNILNEVDTLKSLPDIFINSEIQSNRLNFRQNNFECFMTYNSVLWKINYSIGLRAELLNYSLKSKLASESFTNQFLNIYPSVALSYTTKKNNNYGLSYSRRVNYPAYYQLDPFVYYGNETGIYGGNTNLDPAYVNSFEINYAKYFKSGGAVNFSIYEKYTKNGIAGIYFDSYDSLYNIPTLMYNYLNIGKNSNTGGEIICRFRPAKYLNLLWDGNLFYNTYKQEIQNFKIERQTIAYIMKLAVTFKLKKKNRFQLTGVYKSSDINIIGTTKPQFYINFVYNSSFYKNRLIVNVGIEDIFNWRKEESIIESFNINETSFNKEQSRFLNISLIYKIGKLELENQLKKGENY